MYIAKEVSYNIQKIYEHAYVVNMMLHIVGVQIYQFFNLDVLRMRSVIIEKCFHSMMQQSGDD